MERATIRIAGGAIRKGLKAHFVLVAESYADGVREAVERTGAGISEISIDRWLKVPKNPLKWISLYLYWKSRRKQIQEIFEQVDPDVVHIPGPVQFFYAWNLYRANKPVVMRLPNPPEQNRRGLHAILQKAIWRYLIAPRVSLFVCNCRYTADCLRDVIGPRAEITIIPNTPGIPSGSKVKVPQLANGCVNVVYVGQITKTKGVHLLLEAALQLCRNHRDLHFYLAGDYAWKNEFAENWISRVERAELQQRIVFLGNVENIDGLLRQADINVCPSVSANESFPNVLLEAKAAGLPTVAFPTAGIPEVVTDQEDGIIVSDVSATALQSAIEELVVDRRKSQLMGQSAHRSLQRFDRNKAEVLWHTLYQTVR